MLELAFAALLPIAMIIALGYVLRRGRFLDGAFWAQAEKLAYYVLLPMLFTHGIYSADLSGLPVGAMALGLVGPAVLGTSVILLANRALRFDGPVLTSVVQGGVRFNNYVAVTAAVGLLGVSGAALAALANAILVPTVNVLCALVFARHSAARPSLAGVIRSILFNPLILGCLAGLLLRLSGIVLPGGIDAFLQALGRAALPVGLLCVGAALDWRALGRGMPAALVASTVRFALVPALTLAICLMVGLTGPAALVVVLVQCVPTASSAYVMARQLGGDAPLMAGIIAFQTVLGALTVPLTLVLLAPVLGL